MKMEEIIMSHETKALFPEIWQEGYGIVPKTMMKAPELSVYDKVLLCYMLSYTGAGKNECWPSYETMIHDLKISKGKLSQTINKLEENGYLTRKKLYPNDPLKHNNKYILSFPSPKVHEVDKRGSREKPSRSTKKTSNSNSINSNNTSAHNDLRAWFELHNKDYYHNAKEASFINKLIKKSTALSHDIYAILKDYVILINCDEEPWWKTQPLIPSAVYSLYDRISLAKRKTEVTFDYK